MSASGDKIKAEGKAKPKKKNIRKPDLTKGAPEDISEIDSYDPIDALMDMAIDVGGMTDVGGIADDKDDAIADIVAGVLGHAI